MYLPSFHSELRPFLQTKLIRRSFNWKFQHQSLYHSTPVFQKNSPLLPNKKDIGKFPIKKEAEDEDEFVTEQGELFINNTVVSAKYRHLFSNPFGDFNTPRDLKQRKKVASLKAIHERSRMRASKISHLVPSPGEEKMKEIGSRRCIRVGEMVKEALTKTLFEIKEKKSSSKNAIDLLLTRSNLLIEDVEMTRDLKRAKITWSIWSNSIKEEQIDTTLKKSSVLKNLRHQVTTKISHMKHSPELVFVKKEIPAKMTQLETALDELEEQTMPREDIKKTRQKDALQKKEM